MRILGISGSLRRGSHNRKLLRAAAAALPSGFEFVEWDGLAELPAYDEDLEERFTPGPVEAWRTALKEADAVIIATPEYNSSIPGSLKNALDWASRPFPANALQARPVLVVGASTGLFGAVWAQAETRKTLKAIGAHVLESELPVGMADSAFDADGQLADPELARQLGSQLEDLLREVSAPVEQA
jgi:chromate reductase